jgi:hypothetical protein
MNGFRSSSWLAGCLAACAAVTGCHYASYNDIVDPCWPERYNCMARSEVTTPLGTQASNGLVLDQTVWAYHFREGKEELNDMGKEHLKRLARRRPGPVPEVFLQSAGAEMDGKRLKVVTDYMATLRPDVPFRVAVHNPSSVGLNGLEATTAIGAHFGSAVGSINKAVSDSNAAKNEGTQPQFQQTIGK